MYSYVVLICVPPREISIKMYIGKEKMKGSLHIFSSENTTGRLNQEEWDGRLMKFACNIYAGESEAKKPLVNPRHKWQDLRNTNININKTNEGRAEMKQLRTKCSGRFLWTRQWDFEFLNRRWIYWPIKPLAAFKKDSLPWNLVQCIYIYRVSVSMLTSKIAERIVNVTCEGM